MRIREAVLYTLLIVPVILFTGLIFGLIFGTHPAIGWLPESNFRLATDSRLPRWFSVPSVYSRKDLSVEIYYYSPMFGKSNFKAVLFGPPPMYNKLGMKIGVHRWHPETERKGHDKSPTYVIASVDGIEEIIEHRWHNDIFHITDRPAISEEDARQVLLRELEREEDEFQRITDAGDKFFALESLAELAYEVKSFDKAKSYAQTLLDLADKCPDCCLSESAAKTGNEILRKIEGLPTKENIRL